MTHPPATSLVRLPTRLLLSPCPRVRCSEVARSDLPAAVSIVPGSGLGQDTPPRPRPRPWPWSLLVPTPGQTRALLTLGHVASAVIIFLNLLPRITHNTYRFSLFPYNALQCIDGQWTTPHSGIDISPFVGLSFFFCWLSVRGQAGAKNFNTSATPVNSIALLLGLESIALMSCLGI